jgi:hypothetical protein
MADTSTPFGTISTSQGDQVAKANGLLDAISPASAYALKYATTSGLSLGIHGGKVSINGAVTVISDYTGTLTPSATSYVEANPTTGAISKNTTAYTPGYWRIGRATAGTTTFTWQDDRFNGLKATGVLIRAFPTDANYTLTSVEADNDIISITAGVISTTRDFIVPLIPRKWTVTNNTAQSVRIIGATGTGVTIATLKTAIVYANGTNVIRATADA